MGTLSAAISGPTRQAQSSCDILILWGPRAGTVAVSIASYSSDREADCALSTHPLAAHQNDNLHRDKSVPKGRGWVSSHPDLVP